MYIQEEQNDISEKRREAKRMTKEKFSEILIRCGIRNCDVLRVGGYRHSTHSSTPDIMVYGLSDHNSIDVDQLVKIKILSGYDLISINPKDPGPGCLSLVFGHGYKSGAIKRMITGETLSTCSGDRWI